MYDRWKKHRSEPQPVIPYTKCVAKTTDDKRLGLSVEAHCTYVGTVAKALRERLPESLAQVIPPEASALIALHDVGKVAPGFQKKILTHEEQENRAPGLSDQNDSNFVSNHAAISEAALLNWRRTQPNYTEAWDGWGKILGIHHGSREIPKEDSSGSYGGEGWQKERRALIHALLERFGRLPDNPPTEEQIALLSGMTCVADWIGSDTCFFPAEGLPEDMDVNTVALCALDACGWSFPAIKPGLTFEDIFDRTPYDMQAVFIETAQQPGLYVLEAPMGHGKTEAALYVAYQLMVAGYHHGLYFALPTRLTSNRIHERVNQFLMKIVDGRQDANLIHSTAWLEQLQSGGEELRSGNAWFHPIKRALLWPFGVGTIDQALLSVLRVKHYFVRAFGLAGKVVILDEVHSYDVYTGTLLDELIQRLLRLGCTVIVLSATLTRERRAAFFPQNALPADNAYPFITAVRPNAGVHTASPKPPPSKAVHITLTGQPRRELAELVVARARAGQCVLWINNTIDNSYTAYKAVLNDMREEEFPVGLLHSRFPAYRREELEQEWMNALGKNGNRPKGCVLVATQIVEQSVDIDADFIMTDLAPTDMLLQRVGRLWRHNRDNRVRLCTNPELYIVCPDLSNIDNTTILKEILGPSVRVYAPYVLWRSFQVWSQRQSVSLPDDIRSLLEATYISPDDTTPEWVQSLYTALEDKKQKLRGQALGSMAEAIPVQDDEKVVTRYSTYEQVPALLVRHVESTGHKANLTLSDGTQVTVEADARDWQVTIALHNNLVNMPRWWFGDTFPKTPLYLQSHLYGGVAILHINPDGTLTGPNARPLGYDKYKGVYKIEDTPEWQEGNPDELDW